MCVLPKENETMKLLTLMSSFIIAVQLDQYIYSFIVNEKILQTKLLIKTFKDLLKSSIPM